MSEINNNPHPFDESDTFIKAYESDTFIKAEMHQFVDIDDFKRGMNNFWALFRDHTSTSVNHSTYTLGNYPCLKRFMAMYPDVFKNIYNKVTYNIETNEVEGNVELLFDVYKEISALVDMNDPRVLVRGEVDRFYLCR